MDAGLHLAGAAAGRRARGVDRLPGLRTVVLVEGPSDREAVLALAASQGRDLGTEGVEVLPIGGAHSVRRVVTQLRAQDPAPRVIGLCDEHEAPFFERALESVHVCVRDLEEELIRALGPDGVEGVIERLGELPAFRSFQRQPAQRARQVEAQLRRFLGTHSGRKALYARSLVEACDPAYAPPPLVALLAQI